MINDYMAIPKLILCHEKGTLNIKVPFFNNYKQHLQKIHNQNHH